MLAKSQGKAVLSYLNLTPVLVVKGIANTSTAEATTLLHLQTLCSLAAIIWTFYMLPLRSLPLPHVL
jgi:hypothetical protein